jgi:hypothetical protein
MYTCLTPWALVPQTDFDCFEIIGCICRSNAESRSRFQYCIRSSVVIERLKLENKEGPSKGSNSAEIGRLNPTGMVADLAMGFSIDATLPVDIPGARKMGGLSSLLFVRNDCLRPAHRVLSEFPVRMISSIASPLGAVVRLL